MTTLFKTGCHTVRIILQATLCFIVLRVLTTLWKKEALQNLDVNLLYLPFRIYAS